MRQEACVILNFSHVYEGAHFYADQHICWIECTDISGVSGYCTPEAEEIIRMRIKDFSPRGVHFIDSGNYHYVSRLWLEKIQEPFDLLVFDYHSDMRQPTLADFLSCGGWIANALDSITWLRRVWLVGADAAAYTHIEQRYLNRLVAVSLQSILEGKELPNLPASGCFYISVDKDVLSRDVAYTNWEQGELSLNMLKKLSMQIIGHSRVIGTDICGEMALETLLIDGQSIARNDAANRELLQFFLHLQNR